MREYRCFYAEIAITYSQYGSIWYYYYWWYASTKERVIGCFPNGYIVEAYYLRTFLQLSHVPHFTTTLQKFTERVNGTMLEKIIISSFIVLTKIGQLFVGIDSSGFKATHASQYYAERIKKLRRRRRYIIKLSLAAAADVL